MVSLADLTEKAVGAALKEGADQAEAFSQRIRRINVEIEKNAVKLCTTAYDYGVSVRAFKRGGMGFAYTQRLLEEPAKTVGRKAAKLAHGLHPDPDFVTLPEPKKAHSVPGLYNKELAEISVEEVVGITGRIIDAAKVVPDALLQEESASLLRIMPSPTPWESLSRKPRQPLTCGSWALLGAKGTPVHSTSGIRADS